MSGPTELPVPDTADVRTGPEVSEELLAVLPLLGEWHGEGQAAGAGGDHRFGQWIRFSHDGRPFLAYQSRTWLLDDEDKPVRPSHREFGWWRAVADTDEVEALIISPTGVMELYLGKVDGLKVEMVTDAVVRTATAKEVAAGHRLWGIVEGALMYAFDMAAMGQPLQSHLSARLERVAG